MEKNNKNDYSIEDIEQKIKELEGEYSEKNIKQKIEELKKIIEISEKSPKTFSLDMKNIHQKIKKMKASKEEIMKILEQQRYIAQQEKEISELASGKDEHE